MDLEELQRFCLSLPKAEVEIKWKSDLVFMVGRKMFCMVDLETVPPVVSFKVPDEQYELISQSTGFKPAPWFGRAKWVAVTDATIGKRQLTFYLEQSYRLVVAKLSLRARRELGLDATL